MKKLLFAACLILLLSGNSWALNDSPVTVDVLAKTASSWNGAVLPSYLKGKTGGNDSEDFNSSPCPVTLASTSSN